MPDFCGLFVFAERMSRGLAGKTVWHYDALSRCVTEKKKPVFWLFNDTLYLFVESGAFEALKDFLVCSYKGVVWTLVDADQACQGVIPVLVCEGTPLFVICTTSPASKHWSH
jgi:hypothetical protein